jgi:inosose dehydratase
MAIRLASAPINWGITTPGEEGNPDPDKLLEAVARAGYVGCEFGPFGYFGDTSEEISARFANTGLDTVAIWIDVPLASPLSDETRSSLEEICASLHALVAPYLLVSDLITDDRTALVGRIPDHPEVWWTDDDWMQVRKTLIDIAAIAMRHGRTMAVHPHIGGHIESGAEIERLLEAIDGTDAKLCIDTGHIRIGGVDAIPILEKELHRVVHIHAKDIDEGVLKQLQDGSISLRDAVGLGLFCELGNGMVDWDGFARVVRDGGYSGWVVAEQDRLLAPGSREPYEANERNFRFLQNLLGV